VLELRRIKTTPKRTFYLIGSIHQLETILITAVIQLSMNGSQ
jgi:hypothetical protein